MATHSSILAWTIPWTEAPAGYSPRGCTKSYTTEATEHAWVVSTLGNEQPPGLGLTPPFSEETWIPAHLLRTPHCQGQSSHLLSPSPGPVACGLHQAWDWGEHFCIRKKKRGETKPSECSEPTCLSGSTDTWLPLPQGWQSWVYHLPTGKVFRLFCAGHKYIHGCHLLTQNETSQRLSKPSEARSLKRASTSRRSSCCLWGNTLLFLQTFSW